MTYALLSIERYSNPTKQTSLKRNKNSLDTILRTGLNGSHHNSTLVVQEITDFFHVILLPFPVTPIYQPKTNLENLCLIQKSRKREAREMHASMPACQAVQHFSTAIIFRSNVLFQGSHKFLGINFPDLPDFWGLKSVWLPDVTLKCIFFFQTQGIDVI